MFHDSQSDPSSKIKQSKILEDETGRLFQNVVYETTILCCVISQNSAELIYTMAEA
jgi:hypothetical protein